MRKITFLRILMGTFVLFWSAFCSGKNASISDAVTYTKITSLADLVNGDYIVVNSGDGFAMNNTNAGSYFGNSAVTPSSGTISTADNAIVWTINAHADGGYTIYNAASSKYVSYTGTSNASYAVSTVSGASERWTFSYASSAFTVTNAGATTRILQYNSGSPRFACYTSAQQKLLLYKKNSSSSTTSAPTFGLTGGTYSSVQSVSLASVTSGAKIYYNINGSADPDKTTGTLYTAGSPIALNTSGTYVIKAIAYDANDANPSTVATASYTINLAPSIVSSVSTVPSMYATVGSTDTEKLTVSGTNLTDKISLALSGTDKDLFSLSANEVAQTGGIAAQTEITITYTPAAAGTHSASLTLSSGTATPVVLDLVATAVWPSVSTPVASAATSVTARGFTANWAKATNAASYDVSVYEKSGTKATEAFDGGATSPTDWTFTGMASYSSSSTGYFGASAPSLKFDGSADQVVTPLYAEAVNGISFWIRGAGVDATTALMVEGSENGTNWSTIENIVPLPTAGTLKLYNATSTPALVSGYKQFRFTYTKSAGNLAFDDFSHMTNYQETPIAGSPFNTTDLSLAVSGLTENATYYYTVVGKSDHAGSSASNEISVTTGAVTAVTTPTLISDVRVVNGKIVLNAKAGALVELYNAVGQKLASVLASEGINTLSVKSNGLVVVKQGGSSIKVVL